MKKITVIIFAAALMLALTACQTATTTPTQSVEPSVVTSAEAPTEAPTDTPTEAPTETVTEGPTVDFGNATLPPRFQDLASLELVRDVLVASADEVAFGYRYSTAYSFPEIIGFEVSQVQISGEDKSFSLSVEQSELTVDGTEYVALLTVNGSFEEWEIYPFIIKLSVTFDGGDVSPITDFFSYEHEEIA